MVTIQDVAKKANVSAMTVTRVINSPDTVSDKTKKIVQQAIDELGYIPNFNACALRASCSNFIGITIYNISSPYMTNLVKDLEVSLKKHNKQLIVFIVSESDNDDYKIYCKARSVNLDLHLFVPTLGNRMFDSLPIEDKKRNIQLFRQCYEDIDSFTIDDIEGTYEATNHLIKKGHKKLLLIDFNQRISMKREIGYQKAYAENGLTDKECNLLKLPEFDSSTYEQVIEEAIKKYQPTGIIGVTERIVISCLKVFKKMNIEINKDIDFISYDDSELISHLGISCVTIKFDEMSEKIVSLIDNRLKNKEDAPKSIVLKPFLLVRN